MRLRSARPQRRIRAERACMDRDVMMLIALILAAIAAAIALGLATHILVSRISARRRTSSAQRGLCFWCGVAYKEDRGANPSNWLRCRACGQRIHDDCHHEIRALQADWVCAHPEAILTCPACGRRSVNDDHAAQMVKLTKELHRIAGKEDSRPPGAEH